MGRSPGKWIKRVIFGKKSSRTHTSKRRDPLKKAANDKEHVGGKGQSAQAENSPAISQPVLVNTKKNDIISEPEKGPPADMVVRAVPSSIGQDDQGIVGHDVLSDSEKLEEQQAATRVQAAFRGYLSRRAFQALKGIIRLQALVRGRLVRRQAVVTLRSFQGIVKLQALIRGRQVRLEINTKCHHRKDVDAKQLEIWNEKLLTNAFIRQLLSASPVMKPLQVEYGDGEPNSVMSWMERWTSCHFWNPLPQPKKAVNLKFQARRDANAMESESSRLKYALHRNSVERTDSGPVNAITKPEKPKCMRKVPSSPADSVQEHPQTELEKVKHNLRKVSNLTTEASDKPDSEKEKQTCSLKKVSSSPPDVAHQHIDSADEMKKGTAVTPENKPDTECTARPVASDGPINMLPDDRSPLELHPMQNTSKEDKLSVTNGELSLKDEQPCEGSQKGRQRRDSFSSKSEYHAENGLQNASKLPSYMQTTESAKAKLRGQVLLRSGSDSAEKNSIPRRHSLPSSMNEKLSSQSPRIQKPSQGSGKGAIRNDRSLTSSRDEKAIQIEWRR